MKIKNLLILGCLALGINTMSFAQTNIIGNWDGGGITGAGSEPSNFRWAADPADPATVFTAAGSGASRYMDLNSGSNPVHKREDNSDFVGRALLIRWDNVGATSTATVYSYEIPVALQANVEYRLSGLYEWWNNASAPLVTFKIATDRAATNVVATSEFQTSSTRNLLLPHSFTFTPTTTGTHYLTVGANTATIIAIAELSLVTTSTTSSAKDLMASNYTIYPNPSNRADGLFIAANGAANEAAQLYIYNVTGQLQKQVSLKAAQDSKVDISDLSAGMYVAKVVTSKGSFNKTLVVQ